MDRISRLLLLLSTQDYITYKQLSDTLEVSTRTIYNDVKKINIMLRNHGAQIISKSYLGLRLEIIDHILYDGFLADFKEEEISVTQSVETRLYKIITNLISINGFIRMEDLCEEMYVSRSTLKNDLKKIRIIIKQFDLSISFKPYEGIRLEGSEKDLRRCLAKIKRLMREISGSFGSNEFANIEHILKTIFRAHSYKISKFAFNNLVIHLYIAISRIQTGSILQEMNMKSDYLGEDEYLIAEEIIEELEKEYHIVFPRTELAYVYIHLESKKMMVDNENTVVSSEIYEIVVSMLREINNTFSIDFRHDFELITLLSLHLTPLRARLLHNLTLENPLMLQIREHFPLAYEIANVASRILSNMYEVNITGDEIAYIALHFNVAIERKRKRQKKNVMIVCGTGRGSAELLAYQVKEKYGAHINVLMTHESIDFSDINFQNVDYLLTTVHIQEKIPVPIIEINTFLDNQRDDILQKYINSDIKKNVISYFSKALFQAHIKLDKKEEILKLLCDMATTQQEKIDNFYELVLEREKIGNTSFGNYIAIPHPNILVGKKSFVVVGILSNPINWDGEMVQIIFLLSMKEHGDDSLHGIYKMVSNLLMNKKGVHEIINNPTFEQLLDTINDTAG